MAIAQPATITTAVLRRVARRMGMQPTGSPVGPPVLRTRRPTGFSGTAPRVVRALGLVSAGWRCGDARGPRRRWRSAAERGARWLGSSQGRWVSLELWLGGRVRAPWPALASICSMTGGSTLPTRRRRRDETTALTRSADGAARTDRRRCSRATSTRMRRRGLGARERNDDDQLRRGAGRELVGGDHDRRAGLARLAGASGAERDEPDLAAPRSLSRRHRRAWLPSRATSASASVLRASMRLASRSARQMASRRRSSATSSAKSAASDRPRSEAWWASRSRVSRVTRIVAVLDAMSLESERPHRGANRRSGTARRLNDERPRHQPGRGRRRRGGTTARLVRAARYLRIVSFAVAEPALPAASVTATWMRAARRLPFLALRSCLSVALLSLTVYVLALAARHVDGAAADRLALAQDAQGALAAGLAGAADA